VAVSATAGAAAEIAARAATETGSRRDEPVLQGDLVALVPLHSGDARELALLLCDERLHEFTGGAPPTPTELKERFGLWELRCSPDGSERWLNWAVRLRESDVAVGTVQATIREDEAVVAWVIGIAWQGRGYAKDAARALVRWLSESECVRVSARINPEHAASAAVARAVGRDRTNEVVDGEAVWR
jgi:RimJ/RimL family protein N-acetyltransferase